MTEESNGSSGGDAGCLIIAAVLVFVVAKGCGWKSASYRLDEIEPVAHSAEAQCESLRHRIDDLETRLDALER